MKLGKITICLMIYIIVLSGTSHICRRYGLHRGYFWVERASFGHYLNIDLVCFERAISQFAKTRSVSEENDIFTIWKSLEMRYEFYNNNRYALRHVTWLPSTMRPSPTSTYCNGYDLFEKLHKVLEHCENGRQIYQKICESGIKIDTPDYLKEYDSYDESKEKKEETTPLPSEF